GARAGAVFRPSCRARSSPTSRSLWGRWWAACSRACAICWRCSRSPLSATMRSARCLDFCCRISAIICPIATGMPARRERALHLSNLHVLKRVAHPANILCQRAAAPFLFGRHAEPRRQKARGAGGVVEPDAVAIECASDGRLIDRERGFEHWLARNGQNEIARIVMAVGPGGAVVVEDATDIVRRWVDRE